MWFMGVHHHQTDWPGHVVLGSAEVWSGPPDPGEHEQGVSNKENWKLKLEINIYIIRWTPNVAKNGTMDRMGCKPGPLVSTKYVLPLNTFSTLLLNTHKNLTPIFCDNTPSPIQNYELIWRDVQLKPVLQGCLEIKVQRISIIIWF